MRTKRRVSDAQYLHDKNVKAGVPEWVLMSKNAEHAAKVAAQKASRHAGELWQELLEDAVDEATSAKQAELDAVDEEMDALQEKKDAIQKDMDAIEAQVTQTHETSTAEFVEAMVGARKRKREDDNEPLGDYFAEPDDETAGSKRVSLFHTLPRAR